MNPEQIEQLNALIERAKKAAKDYEDIHDEVLNSPYASQELKDLIIQHKIELEKIKNKQ